MHLLSKRQLPKVAFFDVDGTVVGKHGAISDRVAAAVQALAKRGVRVALATGRPWFAAQDIISQLGVNGTSMFFSGALMADPHSGAPAHSVPLSPLALNSIIAGCREQGLYFEWYTSDAYFVEQKCALTEIHYEYLKVYPRLENFSAGAITEPLLKLVIIAQNEKEEAYVRALVSKAPGVSLAIGSGAAHPGIRFANVVSNEATRERAFAWMLSHHQVQADDVLAFGDAEADTPFLSAAGWGTAMGNAAPEVQKQARFVTASVENDGVALAIEQILSMLRDSR